MKSELVAAAVLMIALPAAAQSRGAGATHCAPVFSGGGGGGYGGGFGAASFSNSPASPSVHYQVIYAHGSEATFVPTRFVSYSEAFKLGMAALAYRPKTVAEVAAEYRAAKAKSGANSSSQPPQH